jgi:hypothetical protein
MMPFLRLRTRYVITSVFYLLTFFISPTNLVAQVKLSVGVAKENITPHPGIKNWVTGKPYSHVHDSLYVKTVVLSDGHKRTAFVTLDIVDAGESLTHEIRRKINLATGIAYDHIVVNASHSHSAPWAPVYTNEFRGKENDTWWAIRYMPAQNNEPHFKKWMQQLLQQTVVSAQKAAKQLTETTLWISKSDASEFMNNRRPVQPTWGVSEHTTPKGYGYTHESYDPLVLPAGMNYGPMDRTMTVLSFKDSKGKPVVSFLHAAIHSVAIYPYSQEISADWPGDATKKLQQHIGGEVLFLQGTAGDINPAKRGRANVEVMTTKIAALAAKSTQLSAAKLQTDSLVIKRAIVGLPLDKIGQERTGLRTVDSEVQVVAMGPLAIVTLPGEPLTVLGERIRERSPFPQTLVLGYSNGNGVHYVGTPEEHKKGGYEMRLGTVGAPESGLLLIETAVRLLEEAMPKQP